MAYSLFREQFRSPNRDNDVAPLYFRKPVQTLLNGIRIKSLREARTVRVKYPLYCQMVRGGRPESHIQCNTAEQLLDYARTISDWKRVELIVRPM
jgi:hypothetical protein